MIELVQEAYTNGDRRTLKRTAHTLKSSTAPVGAEILYDLVSQIEHAASEGDDEILTVLMPQVEPVFLRTKELID